MDPAALKESWTRVCAAGGDAVALYFYSHLALREPAIRDMFPLGMAGQRDKFVNALGTIVASVDQVDRLGDFLARLGSEHVEFGAKPEHYPPVGSSLIATLAHFEGAAWTPELATNWAEAYQAISAVMLEAAESSGTDRPGTWR
ncbi:globin domain-containing protein [Amycolatopsis cihanbeyliensis]|uniref:Hemoglobin-like flavoprotein n=1 Tax=Amycolatopsis cihanbeyliensis TaxID=1128664 RepID=A0A542CSC2_AMYCI|nr:globin domain-containing protein [Amycolatopsis cihanbeyliensis]TQI93728.1 hemoglobin-like flavoprotein [Amycolatopsis cihanbeyliensis]